MVFKCHHGYWEKILQVHAPPEFLREMPSTFLFSRGEYPKNGFPTYTHHRKLFVKRASELSGELEG